LASYHLAMIVEGFYKVRVRLLWVFTFYKARVRLVVYGSQKKIVATQKSSKWFNSCQS
jgi:hypothetical protein